MDPYLFQRLLRRPWLSLCSLALTAVLCFLLCFLWDYQQQQEERLVQTQESFEVLCVVSNRQGTRTHGLRLGSMARLIVTSPEFELYPFVRDLRMTKELEVSCGELGISQAMLLGVTNERCAEALDSDMGGGVVLLEEGFFDSGELLCLVSEERYQLLGAEKTVTLLVTDPYYNPQHSDWPNAGSDAVTFRIAGYYAGAGADVFMPFQAAWDLSYTLSGVSCVDSVSFVAADNLALDALEKAALPYYGQVDPLADEYASPRIALTIHDEQYRATVAALEQNIQRTRYLLPLVALLGLGVSFLGSFLATRGELRTYALMRTLGMTRKKLFWSVLREQLILPLAVIVVLAVLTNKFLPAFLYLLCHTAGCCLVVVRAIRVPPTAILRDQE